MATLTSDKNSVNFDFGSQLDYWQIQSILAGNAGNRATDKQIHEYLLSEGWEENNVKEFIEFINSDLINEMIERD